MSDEEFDKIITTADWSSSNNYLINR
jgi:hypothetical protein